MLQVFYLDVVYDFAMAFQVFLQCFRRMFQVFHVFRHMSQMFNLDILKVDRVGSGDAGDVRMDTGHHVGTQNRVQA